MEKDFSNLDSMVVFDRPLKLPYVNITIYGILFNQNWCGNRDAITELIDSYIQYLSALVRWNEEGGTTSDDCDIWYDKDGNVYPFSANDDYFIDYMQDAYATHPINYQIKWGYKLNFESEDLVEAFIIKNVIRSEWKK